MSLTDAIGIVHAKPRYTSIFPMSLIYEAGVPHTAVKDKGEHVDSGSLEGIIGYDKASSINYAFDRVEQMDADFISSGRYDSLVLWCSNHGYNVPEKPLSYCVSDKYKDAVAFTKPGEQFLGVNTYIDDKIHAMMDDTDLSQDQVEELLMTHEYMHSAQDIEKFGNNVLIVEADNELKLASYFNDIAQSSDDSQLKERYGQMAEVCLARYSGIISCMQGSDDEHHVEGIELSEISDYCIDS